MPVGLHPANQVRRVKRQEPSDGGWEMRVRAPPLERSLRTASRHFSSPRPHYSSRRMPVGLHGVAGSHPALPLGACSSVGRAQPSDHKIRRRDTNKAGECRRDYIGTGGSNPPRSNPDVSPSLVASTEHPANAGGTTWESACLSAGGRWFDPTSGRSDSSVNRLTTARRRHRGARRGECRRDYMDLRVAGSKPAGSTDP